MKSNCGQPISFRDASLMLRKKLFPPPYDPHPWVTGRAETTVEILRSILAIYEFRLQVRKLKDNQEDPADFAKFLYQPEFDRDTGEYIHHREDHNHLLKRIISSLREGLIPGIDLRYFRDALNDGTTGLTYQLLQGKTNSLCQTVNASSRQESYRFWRGRLLDNLITLIWKFITVI